MVKRVLEKYKSFNGGKKILITNFFSLSSAEAANHLLPLITLPYLVRILGPERFGLVAFAQAFIQYFVLLTNYGFNFTATRNVSIHRNNVDKISRIFSSVMFIKLSLLVVSFVILTILVLSIQKFRMYLGLYYCCFGFVIGNVLFPIWLFQGIERMKFIAALNLVAKTIFLVAVFIFVKSKADYLYVPLLTAIGEIIVGILGIGILIKKFHIRIQAVHFSDIVTDLKSGWYVFISTAAINLYTASNTVILGLLTNNTIVGYYSPVEKIIKSCQRLINPVIQSIYPYISRLSSESKSDALRFIKKLIKLLGSVYFILSLVIFIFAKQIIYILLGAQYNQSVVVLRILAFIPLIVGLASIFANFFLLGFGYIKEWSRIIIVCSIVSLLFSYVLVYVLSLSYCGSALSWLLTEFCVLTLSYSTYRRHVHANWCF